MRRRHRLPGSVRNPPMLCQVAGSGEIPCDNALHEEAVRGVAGWFITVAPDGTAYTWSNEP